VLFVSLVLALATSYSPPDWIHWSPRRVLREAPRNIEGRRDRSLHQHRVLVRARGDRHARRFVRTRRTALQQCVKWADPVRWYGLVEPAAEAWETRVTFRAFEVVFRKDGLVSVRSTWRGYGSTSEACVVEALEGYEGQGTVSLVLFSQGARSFREPGDGHPKSWLKAREAIRRGALTLREVDRIRETVEGFRAEPAQDEGWQRRRVAYRERELCQAQAAALGYFRVALELDRRPELEVYLGQAYERLGHPKRAAEAYARYVDGRRDAPDADEYRRRIARLEQQPDTRYRPLVYGPKRSSRPLSVHSVRGACDWLHRSST